MRVELASAFDVDVDATVVFAYLLPKGNAKLARNCYEN